MEKETLAQRIRFVRKEKGLTMEQFGERIGISKQSVSKIEKELNAPAETTIRTICSKFGIDYFWLTEGTGDMYIDNMDFWIEEIGNEKGFAPETTETMKKLFSLPPDTFELIVQLIDKLKDK